MLPLLGNKKLEAFGLDISNASIKVLELSREGDGFFPSAYANFDLPKTNQPNHFSLDEEKLAENIVRAVQKAGKIRSKYVVASVPESRSFVRVLKLPKMDPSELGGAIPWELEQDIPVPVEQVYVSWEVLGEVEGKLSVLVNAALKEYVDYLSAALKKANLKPAAIELESQSTIRAVIGEQEQSHSVLLLDIASVQTSFVIVVRGKIEYTSSIPIAGNALTESLMRNLNISNTDAEKLKKSLGAGDTNPKVKAALTPILENIVEEMKKVIRYYEEHAGLNRVDKILLSGGSAKLAGLTEFVISRLSADSAKSLVKVELVNPWTNLGLKDGSKLPKAVEMIDYSTVVGLALLGINL